MKTLSVLAPFLLLPLAELHTTLARELITNGVPVSPGTYPFFTFNKFGGGAGCGASLIHTDILLTAAHCRKVFEGRGAYVGAATNFGFDDGEFHEDEAALQHPDYRAADFSNDIMLVQLQTRSLQETISIDRHPLKPVLDSNLTVMGFGDTEYQGGLSENLLETHVFASEFEDCAERYRNESQSVLNETTQFCALGKEGRDACQADSGGPVLGLDVNGGLQQIGIVSFGLGCGDEGVPAVYVRISPFIDWIEEGICQLSANPPSTCSTDSNPSSSARSDESDQSFPIIEPFDSESPPLKSSASLTTNRIGLGMSMIFFGLQFYL